MCLAAVDERTRMYDVQASDFHMPKALIVWGADPPSNAAVACPALSEAPAASGTVTTFAAARVVIWILAAIAECRR